MHRSALLRNSLWTVCPLIALLNLGIAGNSAKAQTPQALFPIATQLPVSPFGFPVFAGDFNGDGIPDVAYTTESNSIEIVLSAGTQSATTVTTQLTCQSATGPAQVNFADVNNDKKLDLVYSCSGYIVVQLGKGDGTFQTPAFSAITAGAPVLVDLNGDGFLDIAALTALDPGGQVAVLLNQGATNPGAFQSPKLYPVPNAMTNVLAGDFNGDGKQDLIVNTSTSTSTSVSILYGNGDGTLKAPVTPTTPGFSGFTIGDFNGDGVTDVALLLVPPTNTSLYTSVQILLGSTSGTFSPGASLAVVATSAASLGGGEPLAAVALTGHGNLDLVVDTSVLSIFHGDGKGNFAPTGSYAITNNAGLEGAPMLFADLTGKGNPGLIFGNGEGTFYFPGNGDGTLQAAPGTPVAGPIVDVNNDGIADMVFLPPQGGAYFGTALGRGDGTFSILDQTTPLPSVGYLLMTGDFNGDGNVDTIAIQPGSETGISCEQPPNAQLISYLGSGSGRFQAMGAALPLGVSLANLGVTGDFNSDGKLDLILPYGACTLGLLFVPGNGDGTFGTPVPLSASQNNQYPNLLVGDLNNDGKLDFIWGDAVFLGNGDGTFKQIPLTIPASPAGLVAASVLADLNGDGILDAVSSTGTILYAGNGDGTFQTTPFYTVPLPPNTYGGISAAADVNGDGNPDLLTLESPSGAAPSLNVSLGNGHGNFTQDTDTYYVSTVAGSTAVVPARLNAQAPPRPSDNKLDVLVTLNNGSASGAYVASLLNQTNPTPVKPAPITSTTTLQAAPATGTPGTAITLTASVFGTDPTGSVSFTANGNSLGTEALSNGSATLQISFANVGSYAVVATYVGDSNNAGSTSSATSVTIGQAGSATALQASPASGNLNAQITLKATVTGSLPTGSVSFATGSTSLGKATLSNGVATLQTPFPTAGSYPVTATYQGDANNLGSTSTPVTVVIASPDFTVAATPASGSVTPGQSATFTFTVTPVGGYAGTVKFSCGTLPSLATCSFSPASVTPSGSSAGSSTLTVTTAAATARLNPVGPFAPSRAPSSPWIPGGGLALAGILGLAFVPARTRRWNRELRVLSWGLLLASFSLSVMGCGGGGNSTPSSPGTPAGSFTISVNAADSASGPQHAQSITLSVQ